LSAGKFESAIQQQLLKMVKIGQNNLYFKCAVATTHLYWWTDKQERVGVELEKGSADYSGLEEEANEMQRSINNGLYEKQRSLDVVAKQQVLGYLAHMNVDERNC
jgi:hypothetical protein